MTPVVLNVRNVHHALARGLSLIQEIGELEDSRNGSVLVAPVPVYTYYREPTERVLFWTQRDANPFFHFFESLWMLVGRDDVEFPSLFAKQIASYTDNGHTFHGAYGARWRNWFTQDQLAWAIKRLKNNPNDRRVVISMWDGRIDPSYVDTGGKDAPCNTQVYLRIVKDDGGNPVLCMQVNCRSNDIIWGAYGANAVHMSYLQEYLAANIGLADRDHGCTDGIGWYIQASFNWHAYTDFMGKMLSRQPEFGQEDDLNLIKSGAITEFSSPYERTTCRTHRDMVRPHSLINDPDQFEEELKIFMGLGLAENYRERFFKNVALPLAHAHQQYREGNYDNAIGFTEQCAATDWRLACLEWLNRRKAQKSIRNDQSDTKAAERRVS